jgi:uncharacterized protein
LKEIDRPLGQRRDRHAPRRGGRMPGAREAATLAVAATILAVSTVIAMQDPPWRTPAETVVVTPEVAAVAPPPTAAQAPSQPRAEGPAIIKVPPQPDQPIVLRDPTSVAHDTRTAHMPDRALIEESAHGPLPVRAADGRRPVDVYARPWSGARGAKVAIVIGGMGVSQTGTQSAITKLPPEVTLAFAPQGNSLDRWMQDARRRGHELVLQIPLEPFDYPNVDPGRNTLTVEADADENLDALHASLGRMTNYVGVVNYMGARFLAEPAAVSPLMGELSRRGLLFLDDGSTARSLAGEQALANRVPFAAADAAIDAQRDRPAILKKLDELERTARARGHALGIGFAFDTTVDAVAQWAAEARRRGIEIVPVSALAADPERR